MPEIVFAEGELPPERPQEMMPEWIDRWQAIGSRLIERARLRGGTGAWNGNDLVLHAPVEGGACIRVILGEPGRARVDADDLHVPCDWGLSDDEPHHDLDQVIAAIMDGDAEVTITAGRFRAGTYSGSATPEPITRALPAWNQAPK